MSHILKVLKSNEGIEASPRGQPEPLQGLNQALDLAEVGVHTGESTLETVAGFEVIAVHLILADQVVTVGMGKQGNYFISSYYPNMTP